MTVTPSKEATMTPSIEEVVRARYGAIATSGLTSRDSGVRSVAVAFGYSPHDLAAIPAESNMGLSCGSPTSFANLKPGEVVVDLGSGGGLDVFLAARQVGPQGRVIGIDMTPEMIELARRNAAEGVNGQPIQNVEFHQATIDRMPLPDASVDCVLSNCVINLAADKQAVFREIYRVLKPGGRLCVSDIALLKPLPPEVSQSVLAYIGCVAGAILIDDYRAGLIAAGFADVEIVNTRSNLNVYRDTIPSTCLDVLPSGGGCCGGSSDSTFQQELGAAVAVRRQRIRSQRPDLCGKIVTKGTSLICIPRSARLLERPIVLRLVEQPHPSVPAIEITVDHSRFVSPEPFAAWSTWCFTRHRLVNISDVPNGIKLVVSCSCVGVKHRYRSTAGVGVGREQRAEPP